jgi:hypothetical protein
MDHATPYPTGDTSAANCGGLCRGHHHLKTTHHLDLTHPAADGSATLTTTWGQRVRIHPKPFLHDPTDHAGHPPATPPPDRGTIHAPPDDDPPF